MSDTRANRITAALAHWRETVKGTGTVFMVPNDTPADVSLGLQRILFAAGPLALAVEDELPALLAQLAAADKMAAAIHFYLETDDLYSDLADTLVAYRKAAAVP